MGVVAAGALAACSAAEAPTPQPGEVLAATKDIGVGEAIPILLGEHDIPIILTQTPNGTFRAFSAVCTHQGCKVNPPAADAPEILHCPCHGSEFDTYTGAVLKGPAEQQLPEFPVRVEGDNVVAA